MNYMTPLIELAQDLRHAVAPALSSTEIEFIDDFLDVGEEHLAASSAIRYARSKGISLQDSLEERARALNIV